MTRNLAIHRKPLREREQPINSDVADAITALVHQAGGLPAVFTKADVVAKLIEIAHTEEDGAVRRIMPIDRRTKGDAFINRLTNSTVFQAGYKHYEDHTKNPVVPVTDFFLKNVCSNGNIQDALDNMSPFEVIQSLPKRRSRMHSSDPDGDYIRSEDGEILQSGEIAGVVVFPPNSPAELQRAWLTRLAGYTVGSLDKTTERLEHARPDTASVAALREQITPIKPALRKALPRPRRDK